MGSQGDIGAGTSGATGAVGRAPANVVLVEAAGTPTQNGADLLTAVSMIWARCSFRCETMSTVWWRRRREWFRRATRVSCGNKDRGRLTMMSFLK
jgi:predicted alpha/beta-hydrolase family hydrolase